MASDAQIQANQTNARAHATGPKSPGGKKRSSLNSLKHGLAARALVPPDGQETFDELLAAWLDQVRPADQFEMAQAQALARAELNLRRCDAYKEALVEARRRRAGYDFALAEADRADRLGQRLLSGGDPEPPSILARALGSFAAGADWLIRRWEEVLLALKNDGALSGPEVRRFLRVWGLDPADAIDPVVRAMLAGADDPEAADNFAEVATVESRRLRERKAQFLDAIAEAERSGAAARAGHDPGEEGVRLSRYEAAAERSFHKAVKALREHRRDPEAVIAAPAAPAPAPAPAPSPPGGPVDPRSSFARALEADDSDVDLDADLGAELAAIEAALGLRETERTQSSPGSEPAADTDLPPEPPPGGPGPA
jgi:hypothetical protein